MNTMYTQHMIDPKNHWATKAEKLKNERKFEEAIKLLDKVQELEKDEKADDFWYKKAIHYYEFGEYEQAKYALDKELETNQKRYDTFFLLGKILYELKKDEESLECFNKAAEEHNRQHLKNTQKIEQMKNVHKFEEAIKYSDLVYQEKIVDYTYWYYKGMVLLNLKKFNEASSCFKTVLETNPDNPQILYYLAKSELGAGKKQKSLEILEKACAIEPVNKEKLRIDEDFDEIAEEKHFRIIKGSLNLACHD